MHDLQEKKNKNCILKDTLLHHIKFDTILYASRDWHSFIAKRTINRQTRKNLYFL